MSRFVTRFSVKRLSFNRCIACWFCVVCVTALGFGRTLANEPIDRKALVTRHNIQIVRYQPEAPVSVGNGEFAFTFDVTGLQTFPSDAAGHVPLGTMTQWGWHAFPGSETFDYSDTLVDYPVHGRMVSYATNQNNQAGEAIRANPHRFNLARIGLRLVDSQGVRAKVDDLIQTQQTLDLWTGQATSTFEFDGKPVTVSTVAHPRLDAIAFEIASPLLDAGQLAVEVRFAYPAGVWGPRVDDGDQTERHQTTAENHAGRTRLVRQLDATRYLVDIHTHGKVQADDASPHVYTVVATPGKPLEAVVCFSPDPSSEDDLPSLSYTNVRAASAEHWKQFWTSGGAIDLSKSRDLRWHELERRIVLSQFLTAINCAGSMPPQETGLVCNSWFGKAHLEMHWWHAAHFPIWGRFQHLQRSLDWYQTILPAARRIAQRQGYAGVRWPKMTGPGGISSPSEVGELLIWQQPHPIYFAEQAYQHDPTEETLKKYQEIVVQSAEFMADYAHYDPDLVRYVLGPVLIPAQECYDGRSQPGVLNPTYELAYWRWALRIANQWQQRLGLEANEKWSDVAEKIARPHVRDGVYTAIENAPFTTRHDHPSMLAALGVLPDVGLIDPATMRRTLDDVDQDWQWSETWGWDYPMMAMTAARLGQPAKAIDYLLLDTPKNHFLVNGHCFQADRLPIYLPANGGLLMAVGMMAAGWESAEPLREAPGFPQDGSWTVQYEGLTPMF